MRKKVMILASLGAAMLLSACATREPFSEIGGGIGTGLPGGRGPAGVIVPHAEGAGNAG